MDPLTIGLIGGAVGAGASALGGLMGVGKTNAHVTPYQESKGYAPVSYGQTGIGAGYDQRSLDAQSRGAPTLDFGQANYDYTQQQQARAQEQGLADMLQASAAGTGGPSAAAGQMQQGLDQAQRQAFALAASQHGGLNSAAGTRAAVMQGGEQAMQANQAAGILRAQEQLAARGQLAGVLGQMRGGDLSARGQSQGQTFGTADVQQRQTGLNDAYSLGLIGAANQARGASAQTALGQQQINAGSWDNAQAANAGIQKANDAAASQWITGGLNAITGGLATGLAGSAAKPSPGGGGYPGSTNKGKSVDDPNLWG